MYQVEKVSGGEVVSKLLTSERSLVMMINLLSSCIYIYIYNLEELKSILNKQLVLVNVVSWIKF